MCGKRRFKPRTRKDGAAMAVKTPYTVVVADDEDELREAVCTMIPWEDVKAFAEFTPTAAEPFYDLSSCRIHLREA